MSNENSLKSNSEFQELMKEILLGLVEHIRDSGYSKKSADSFKSGLEAIKVLNSA